MSQLNLKQILSGDNLSTVVDKLNYNFDQIILNGGGPQGLRGIIGAPGLPGAQGLKGETGPTGEAGTHIYADGATPGSYPFGTGGEVLPRIGDIYIETDPTFLNIYELNATGGSGSYWNLVETISAPSSSWDRVYDNSTPAYDGIGNDPSVAAKLFIGSTSSFDQGSVGDADTFFDSSLPVNYLKPELSFPFTPNAKPDAILTVAGKEDQLRIISNGLSGATGSIPNLQTNRGGIIHSLQKATFGGSEYQIYKIVNADIIGEKAFVLSLNSSSLPSLYSDLNNKVATGVPQLTPLVAQFTARDSVAVGDIATFITGATFANNQGVVTQGNLSVGLNNNTYATILARAATASSLVVDVASSVGTPNVSFLTIGSDITSGSNPRRWTFYHDAQNSVSNQYYGSLNLLAFTPTSFTSEMFFGLTSSGVFLRPRVGVSNVDPIGTFEVGYLSNNNLSTVSLGVVPGLAPTENFSGHIGFNLHRGITNWYRRGNGSSNAGRAIWSTIDDSSLNISYFGSTGGATASTNDAGIYGATRTTFRDGSIWSSDSSNTRTLISSGLTGFGLSLVFPASGTTGSGATSGNYRRYTAVIGDPLSGNQGNPMISSTNGLTGSSIAQRYPQYAFYGNDQSGLYVANKTSVNSGIFSTPSESIGLAVGGTNGLSVHGNSFASGGVRVGLANSDPYEKLHIGNFLTYHDIPTAGDVKYFGYNVYSGAGADFRLFGSATPGATQEGYLKLAFPSTGLTSTNTSLSRFNSVGTKFAIELGTLGGTSTGVSSPFSTLPGQRNYRGVVVSPPLVGPSATHNNLATHVPQVTVGLNTDLTSFNGALGGDSTNSGKRGTLAIAAQGRTKPRPGGMFGLTIEDNYNIGLYSYDGWPVAAISSAGGNPSTSSANNFALSFIGLTGDAIYEDISILQADSNIALDRRWQRRAFFGNGFRVGINEVPNWINTPLAQKQSGISAISPPNGPFVSAGFDVASLVVAGATAYWDSNPVLGSISTILRGSVIFDTTGYGGNDGIFFRNGLVAGEPGGKPIARPLNTYPGDWGLQYIENSGRSGLNFWKPFNVGTNTANNILWLDDEGSVGVGTTNFSYTPVNNTSEQIFNMWVTGGLPVTGPVNGLPNNNTAYTAKFAVSGSLYCEGIQVASDARMKDEIARISSDKSLEAIKQLSPLYFRWKEDQKITSGFFAQEIEKIIPESVFKVQNGKFEDGQYSLEMWPFIAHLVGAVKAQQSQIEEKDLKIKNLEERLSKIEQFLSKHGLE